MAEALMIAAAPALGRDHAHEELMRLTRAVALNPAMLILEHPTVGLAAGQGKPFGDVVARVAAARSLATLIISADADFSSAAATRQLTLQGGTGELKPRKRRLFGF